MTALQVLYELARQWNGAGWAYHYAGRHALAYAAWNTEQVLLEAARSLVERAIG